MDVLGELVDGILHDLRPLLAALSRTDQHDERAHGLRAEVAYIAVQHVDRHVVVLSDLADERPERTTVPVTQLDQSPRRQLRHQLLRNRNAQITLHQRLRGRVMR